MCVLFRCVLFRCRLFISRCSGGRLVGFMLVCVVCFGVGLVLGKVLFLVFLGGFVLG